MERPKHRPEAFEKAELGLLNSDTIGWFFDGLGHEVLYRETPQGPEVLAVGFDEAIALQRAMPEDEQRTLKHYAGY